MTTTPSVSAPETLIFACSGAADVGEIADRAARALMKQGIGKMFCLAGVGGQIPEILHRTAAAGRVLVIDGCEKDCGRHCLERSGLPNFVYVRLTDQQLEKGKTPVTEPTIARIAEFGAQQLAVTAG